MAKKLETITLAGGCFWCTEAIFKRLKGVYSVIPGYTGGNTENPSYEQVCSGKTGHAEAIQIKFDSDETPLDKILDVFWQTHTPTTLNQQGSDLGTQYRSAVFFQDEKQKRIAEKSKARLERERVYANPIVTEITLLGHFYAAEDYHQNYFEKNRNAIYCQLVISPKIHKLLEKHGQEVKEEYKNR